MDYRIYLAGPSAEIWNSNPGESEIEQLFVEFEEHGLKPVFDWPRAIREFMLIDQSDRAPEEKLYYRKRSMRKDLARIVEADVLIFALIDGAPSTGMMFEAGVAAFLGKPVIFYCKGTYSLDQAKFECHEFGTMFAVIEQASSVEEVGNLLIKLFDTGVI
jgi:nucleoside 2-deoxyribosyltransferase